MSCNFLWGDTAHHQGYHTVKGETITLLKEAGGLGIPSIRHRNLAILMNQAWCLYTNPNMLWAQVLKAKYFPHTTLFTSESTNFKWVPYLDSFLNRSQIVTQWHELDCQGCTNYSGLEGPLAFIRLPS